MTDEALREFVRGAVGAFEPGPDFHDEYEEEPVSDDAAARAWAALSAVRTRPRSRPEMPSSPTSDCARP